MFFGRKKRTVREKSRRQSSEIAKSRPKKVGGRGCNPYDSTGRSAKRQSVGANARPKRGSGSTNPYDTASKHGIGKDPWAGVRRSDFDRR